MLPCLVWLNTQTMTRKQHWRWNYGEEKEEEENLRGMERLHSSGHEGDRSEYHHGRQQRLVESAHQDQRTRLKMGQ